MSSTFTPSEKLIGQTLQGRYRILEFIAEGGMGGVYRGERLGLERSVAIRFFRPILAADTQGRRRFGREAEAMSRLDHPNYVSVTEFGMAPETYIVMEYVTGEPCVRLSIAAESIYTVVSTFVSRFSRVSLTHTIERSCIGISNHPTS